MEIYTVLKNDLLENYGEHCEIVKNEVEGQCLNDFVILSEFNNIIDNFISEYRRKTEKIISEFILSNKVGSTIINDLANNTFPDCNLKFEKYCDEERLKVIKFFEDSGKDIK